MKNKYDPIKALKVPLTSYEQEIEDAIDPATSPKAPVEMLLAVQKAATTTLKEMRGGKRESLYG